MTRHRKKTSKRLRFKNSPSAIGTQYIKKGHLNKVLRGSGFFSKTLKKIKNSKIAKKLIVAAKNQLKNKKTRKLIVNTATKALNKIDNVSNLPPSSIKKRRREQKKVMDKIVQNFVSNNDNNDSNL